METKLNDLCVGVGRLIGCNCNNTVNRLEQEAPLEALFEALSNIGIDDLIVQEVVEELEKACKALEVSPKDFSHLGLLQNEQ